MVWSTEKADVAEENISISVGSSSSPSHDLVPYQPFDHETWMASLQEQVRQLKQACQEQQLNQRGAVADLQESVDAALAEMDAKLTKVPQLSCEWMVRMESMLNRIEKLEDRDVEQGLNPFEDSKSAPVQQEMVLFQDEFESKIEKSKQASELRFRTACSGVRTEEIMGLIDHIEGWKEQTEFDKLNIRADLEELKGQMELNNEHLVDAVTSQVFAHLRGDQSTEALTLPMGTDDLPIKETVMDLVSEMEVFREDLLELTGIDGKVDFLQAGLSDLTRQVNDMRAQYSKDLSVIQEQVLKNDNYVKEQAKADDAKKQFREKIMTEVDNKFTNMQLQLEVYESSCQQNLEQVTDQRDAIHAELQNHREESVRNHHALQLDFTTQLDDLRSQFSQQTKILTETLQGIYEERNEYIQELQQLRKVHQRELESAATGFRSEISELRDDVDSHREALAQAQSKMRVMYKERELIRGELKLMKHDKFMRQASLDVRTSLERTSNTAALTSHSLPSTPREVVMRERPFSFSRKGSICRPEIDMRDMMPEEEHPTSPRRVNFSKEQSTKSMEGNPPFAISTSSLEDSLPEIEPNAGVGSTFQKVAAKLRSASCATSATEETASTAPLFETVAQDAAEAPPTKEGCTQS